jgi:hypothetical protein
MMEPERGIKEEVMGRGEWRWSIRRIEVNAENEDGDWLVRFWSLSGRAERMRRKGMKGKEMKPKKLKAKSGNREKGRFGLK